MHAMSFSDQTLQGPMSGDVESLLSACREKFTEILSDVLHSQDQEAHRVEASIFKHLMELGFLLLNLFFSTHHLGDYGPTLETGEGTAERGRPSAKSYFSIFGKLNVKRYLYHLGEESFAPLDIVLNLPIRCYSYFLSEWVNQLTVNRAYAHTSAFLKKFLGLALSVSASETLSQESATQYEAYYAFKKTLPKAEPTGAWTVVSFDGKGVPMIKKEAAKIQAKLGKGEKRQKKKEALVGAKYTIDPNPRTPEEVARNLVFPEQKEECSPGEGKTTPTAQDIRYIASVEKPKRAVMEEIFEEIQEENFDKAPLLCLVDGAKSLVSSLGDAFRLIANKVIILDIIHVVEYIWLIAHLKYGEGNDEARHYVYDHLLMILKGDVSAYIQELDEERKTGSWKTSQENVFSKVMTYLENHQPYMNYGAYLAQGYPIATGVVESACGHVVSDRMEISGARWGIQGSEAILRLRSVYQSQDWEEYWTFYTAQFRDKEFLQKEDNVLNLQEKMAA